MHLDSIRLEVSAKLDRKQRSALGQFMTPTSVADFMASLFPPIKGVKGVKGVKGARLELIQRS